MPSKSTYYRRKYLSGAISCRYNTQVDCAIYKVRDCEHCGWNPAEELRRKEALHNGEKVVIPMETVGV